MNEAQFLNKKVFFKNCQFRESNKTCLFQYFLKINTSKNKENNEIVFDSFIDKEIIHNCKEIRLMVFD